MAGVQYAPVIRPGAPPDLSADSSAELAEGERADEVQRKQQEMHEEEDIDPEESARICFVRAENKRLLKVKETEKLALQKQIDAMQQQLKKIGEKSS